MGWSGWNTYSKEDKVQHYFVGDDGWDLLGIAVAKLEEVYLKTFKRRPTREELRETLEFVIGDYPENLDNI